MGLIFERLRKKIFINLTAALCIAYYITPTIFIASQEQAPCDPFDIGVNPDIFQGALKKGVEDPNACLCTFPCTVDKATEFTRFYYFKRGMDQYELLDVTRPYKSPLFNYRRSLKFVIHGYVENGTSGFPPPTGVQLANDFCGYVISVDYGTIANCSYARTVAEIVPSVATYVAQIIERFNFDPKKIEMVGHSIGAHLCGYVGAAFNGDIQKITGLDPAGALYDQLQIGLNQTNAQFVQVLHTTPGLIGTELNRGDADFYANNRSEIQPGCPIRSCGHAKAVYYYYASLFPEFKFQGIRCGQTNGINLFEFSRFGEFNDGQFGQFCFDTTPCFPYASTIEYHCAKKHSSKKHKKCKDCKSKHSKCKHHD